ncbi:PAS domain S-box protein [Halostella sp. JP-L12]|nr:PAS domain S-box protein [Halostella sp. JP-L12]
MVQTLQAHTEAKTGLREHRQYLRELYEITADGDLSFDEKMDRLLDLGCDRFDLDMGFFLKLEGDEFRVVRTRGTDLEEGVATLSACPGQYCKQTITVEEPVGVEDVAAAGWDDDPLYREHGLGCYLGSRVTDGDGVFGSVCFSAGTSREVEFADAEYAFLDLMGQWVSYELEREQREAALQRSKDRFEGIFENSLDGIFINDPYADEMIDANPAGCEMLGHSREEVLSKGPSDFHPDEMDRFQEFVEEVYEEGSGWTDELTCLRSDGRRIPVDMSASRLDYDDRSAMLAIVRDISERKEHERFQRRLYDVAADPDRSFDEKLQAMLDLGCERFGTDLGGIARVDPDTDLFEVEATNGDHEYLVPGDRYPFSETYCRLVTEDGQTAGVADPDPEEYEGQLCYDRFGVRTYLGTYLEVDGDVDRTFWFVSNEPRDEAFSEAERTFHRLMGQWVSYELERKQYEDELEGTVERLQQSNERLEQFAYAASHDLQEPLRMVSSYLQLIENRYGEDLDDDAREFLDFAVDGANRMQAMIEGLLEYSRIETRGNPFEPVELDAVLEDVRADLQLQIAESGAEIEADELPRVRGDESQLHQLFQNLLSNAIEYSGDGPPRVSVSAERTGGRWVISVSDDGIGIDPDDADRIFEVFQRLHARDEYEGTGIGLALCKRIVERHGGDIWVDSHPGDGATFSFTLPDSQPESSSD